MLNAEDFHQRARARLPRFVLDYVDGGADAERCIRRNEEAIAEMRLTPAVLNDTRAIDTSVTVFGRRWKAPLGIAPVGFAGLVRPGGDTAMARAAAAAGLPFVLSTASNERLEHVRRAAPGAEQWMQLYVMGDRSIAEQIVRRAKASSFDALVLTVDVPVSGLRERDVRNGFRLPFRPTLGTLLDIAARPAWALRTARAGAPGFVNLAADPAAATSPQVQAALLARTMDRGLTWDSLKWLRSLWDGPLLLKGVLSAADARRAVQHGVDGLIVSNHGGRQLDEALPSISALPAVADAAHGRVPVFVDGGFRRGSDIPKALASGAAAVFLGRPALWALAADGERGVGTLLDLFVAQLERTLILLGADAATRLGPSHLGDTPQARQSGAAAQEHLFTTTTGDNR